MGVETAMPGERFDLEDQVGGLIDHVRRRARRRPAAEPIASEPADVQHHDVTAKAEVTIRAARASDELTHRRVA